MNSWIVGTVKLDGEENDEEMSKMKKKCKNKGNDGTEKYEKSKSKQHDEAFHHFKKAIAPYPGQLIR